ncbi:MAG: hypothetical protein ACOCZD_00115 [Haloferacaceae archaeon]
MSDTRNGARSVDEVGADGSLLTRFRNPREALPDRAVAKPESERFHRSEAERAAPTPACQRVDSDDWRIVDVDEALAAGLTPCRACWKAVLEYLAADPDSPVAYRDPNATTEPTGHPSVRPYLPERHESERPRLTSRTDKVMIAAGSKYHAPAGDETLCGRSDYRVVDRAVVESHYDPCRNCFELDN